MNEEGQSRAASQRTVAAGMFRFGPYCFDVQERALYKNGSDVQLPPRALVVLERLLHGSGHIVSKTELLELWGDISISEQSLTEAIFLIRKELGDTAEQPTYIETLRKRGFRFIAPVEVEVAEPAHARQSVSFAHPGATIGPADALRAERGATVALAPLLAGWGITMFWWLPAILIAGTLGGWVMWNAVGSELREALREYEEHRGRVQRNYDGALGKLEVWNGESEDNTQLGAPGVPTPDGRAYVYLWNGLFVRDLVTKTTQRIAPRNPPCKAVGPGPPAISPRGDLVAYDCRNSKRDRRELWLVGIDGSNNRRLHADPSIDKLELGGWSRNGSIVAFVNRKDATRDLVLFDVASGVPDVLQTDRPEGGNDGVGRHPSVSPDGTTVVYERGGSESKNRNLYLISRGGRERRLTRSGADDYSPLWLPDGNGIFFLSDRSGVIDGWMLPFGANGPSPDAVHLETLGDVMLSGFTDDRALFYFEVRDDANVYLGEMNFETGKLLSRPAKISHYLDGNNWAGDWSADGRYLVWQTGGQMLQVFDLETREETSVPARMETVISPSWNPDGEWITVLGAGPTGHGAVWEINRTTGMTLPLLADPASSTNLPRSNSRPSISLTHPAVSPDGSTLFFVRRRGRAVRELDEQAELIAHDLETRKDTTLLRGFFGNPALSPDGRHLAFQTRDGEDYALQVFRFADDEQWTAVKLTKDEGMYFQDWTADGRYLVYTHGKSIRNPRPNSVWRVSLDGRDVLRTELEIASTANWIKISAYGKHFALSWMANPKASVLRLDNFLPS